MEVRILQRDLLKLIKLAVSEHPIDLSKFITKTLEEILPKVKEQLEIDFDKIRVYPGPQPRESADIELYKGEKIVMKLNEKTCISGNLKVTIRKLKESLRQGENGLIVAFAIFEKEDMVDSKMIIILIPEEVIRRVPADMIGEYIIDLLWQKTYDEAYKSYYLIAFNEAVNLIRARETILAVETAEKARKEAEEARKEAREAKEEARMVRKEAEEARKEAKMTRKEIEKLNKKIDEIDRKIEDYKLSMESLIKKYFEALMKKISGEE